MSALNVLDAEIASAEALAISDAYHAERLPRLREAREAIAGLIAAVRRVQMIPSPVGTGYSDGTPEDRAYFLGFNYALRLARAPDFDCGLDAALARIGGES